MRLGTLQKLEEDVEGILGLLVQAKEKLTEAELAQWHSLQVDMDAFRSHVTFTLLGLDDASIGTQDYALQANNPSPQIFRDTLADPRLKIVRDMLANPLQTALREVLRDMHDIPFNPSTDEDEPVA